MQKCHVAYHISRKKRIFVDKIENHEGDEMSQEKLKVASAEFWKELPKVIEKLEREKKALDQQTRKN